MLLRLKQEAKTRNVSLNQLILVLLRRELGLSHKHTKVVHHDLDKLAGTWSKKEVSQFQKAVESFNQVDEGMWQ